MRQDPDRPMQSEVPILRRADGSIETDVYLDRARRLRNICLADALLGVVTMRFCRRRPAHPLPDQVALDQGSASGSA